jgi:glycosyltransferase involved in cell wall biosynthesis
MLDGSKKTLRIGLLPVGGYEWAGGWYYVQNLARSLSKLRKLGRRDLQVFYLTDRHGEDGLDFKKTDDFDEIIPIKSQAPAFLEKIQHRLARQLGITFDEPLLSTIHRHKIDLVFSSILRGKNFKSAVWIPDFIHMHPIQLVSEREKRHRQSVFDEAAKKAQRIIVSSQCVADEIQHYLGNYQNKTSVVHFRSVLDENILRQDPHASRNEYHLPDRYFILSNQFWRSKNHLIVFKALQNLLSRGVRMHVVFTGSLNDVYNPRYRDEILSAVHTFGIASCVSILGFIPREKQLQLARASMAYIQPSLWEGWNTSVEEARCFGKPIILSDTPIHREQKPPKSTYFDPENHEALADEMMKLWNDASLGFDVKSEQMAFAAYEELVIEYAECFLNVNKM